MFGTSCSTFFKICDSELCLLHLWEGVPVTAQFLAWQGEGGETEEGQVKVLLFFVKTYNWIASETTLPSSVQDWFKRRFREKSEKRFNFFKKTRIFLQHKNNLAQQSISYYRENNFVLNLRAIFTLDIFWYPHQGTFVWLKVRWKWREIFAVKQVLVLFLPGGILILKTMPLFYSI